MPIQVIGFLVGYPKIDFPHSVITGNSLSEALIFASTNPQHDDRLFIEFRITSPIHENSKLKPGENMLCTEIVSDIQNNFCTPHVLSPTCSAKRRASDKDLPVHEVLFLKDDFMDSRF